MEIIEKDPSTIGTTRLNNCGIFILSSEIFEVLRHLSPTKRGEIEIPQAINRGIVERYWKVFVFKLEKDVFRGDFGDKEVYEELKNDVDWIKKLNR